MMFNQFYPPSFEGQAHQRPVQSYAGADTKKNRADLLKHLEEERRKRERTRQREAASTKLQSAWRGTIVRNDRQKHLAKSFHEIVENLKNTTGTCDTESADALLRCIVFSRSYNLADDDIHWFASQILKDVKKFLPVVLHDSLGKPVHYRLTSLLLFVLKRICLSSKSTTGLRLLELFLNPQTYLDMVDDNYAEDIVKQSIEFLINHDYYTTLCQTLISKTDANTELLTGQSFPFGFSGAILQLMLLPLRSSKKTVIWKYVVDCFVFDVVCRPEAITARYILPAFLLSEVADQLPIIISTCFLENRDKVAKLDSAVIVHVLWCTLSALKSVDLTALSSSESRITIECLSFLLGQMVVADEHASAAMEVDGDYSDDDSEGTIQQFYHFAQKDEFRWPRLPDYVKRMHTEIINHLCNDRSFAMFLRLAADSTGEDCTCQIAYLFYQLIYRHRVTPGQMRGSSLPVFDKVLLRRFYFKAASLVGPIVYPVQVTVLQRIQSGNPLHYLEYDMLVPILTIFTKFFHWLLLCVNDPEFLDASTDGRLIPFSTSELVEITSNLRKVCAGLVDVLSPSRFLSISVKISDLVTKSVAYIPLFRAACHLLKHLYCRNCRLNFLPMDFWSSVLSTVQPIRPPPFGLVSYLLQPFADPDCLLTGEYAEQVDPALARAFTTNEIHLAIVLTYVPFLLPFDYRYDVFRAVLDRDHEANMRSRPMGLDDGLTIDVRVRRQYLYEDAFDKLSLENAPNMKKRIRCQLINFTGLDEAGIDGGGLFREFLSELIRTAFDPNRGLFCFTPTLKDGRLYPNPAAENLYPDNWKAHFFFLGRIVGKLMYEKLLVELPLADFFLAKVLSRDFASLDVHHLADLDPVLYKNLLYLKTYTGNVEDLGLDFTIVEDSQVSENPRVIELIPNGKNVLVSAENRIQYTHLVADYKLNRRISGQCRAFVEGLSHVISLDWLRMFSPTELQWLISGAEKEINVSDLMANTRYHGGYNEEHPTIKVFWAVVKNRLTEEQRRKLLLFVTSCSRPPMFGFKDLVPPFTIHSSGSPDNNGPAAGGLRLPSASTCINLLKLPEYKDEESMLERLCYSLESQSGFELS